jgi:hypothetical protein
MDMPGNKVRVNQVDSCNLGKLGPDGVALKINFATGPAQAKEGRYQSAVFGLSNEVARGLARALTAVLEESAKPTQPKARQN